MTKKRKGRQTPAGDQPESPVSPEPQAAEESGSKKELAELKRELKAMKDAQAKAERAKLGEVEALRAELEETRKELASTAGELGSVRKETRSTRFRDEVQALAPGVPQGRLRGLLAVLESEGFDTAPESPNKALAGKAVERLKQLDPDSFRGKGGDPPPPVTGDRPVGDGSIDYRRRGQEVAGRKAQKKKPAATTRKKRK